MKRANELGMLCFSSPFDETAVDFLEDLNVPAYKIASFENIHLPLIKKVASTGKPMIISTGMATIAELDETVRTIRKTGCQQFVLLKCTSSYPASPENSNVFTIPHMRKLFGCEVGLSDHTMGTGAAVAAVAHGATAIEKHFTLRRADGGVDSAFSLEPEEMKQLVIETERAWQSLGKVTYGPSEVEKGSLTFRRSLYIAENMKKGDVLTKENLRIVRPGLGLPPKYYDVLLGRKINQNVKKGTAVRWGLISI
jgi:N-acetylneuraminate synthase